MSERTMPGGRHFKVIREDPTLPIDRSPAGHEGEDVFYAEKCGDDLLVSPQLMDAIEEAVERGKDEVRKIYAAKTSHRTKDWMG